MMPMSTNTEAMPMVRQMIKDLGGDMIGSF